MILQKLGPTWILHLEEKTFLKTFNHVPGSFTCNINGIIKNANRWGINLHLLLRNPKQKISNGTSLIAELNSDWFPKSGYLPSCSLQSLGLDSELRSRVKRKTWAYHQRGIFENQFFFTFLSYYKLFQHNPFRVIQY